ncbi:uncharacterized protein Z520_05061 [Fonsecaea multimorphosa CBS 102226]|uniref:Uncharacterized protein n=1 Tax=Fonsecaea multimorphosa CBS 102226 TaxID=1442371 RepID=A0A0D2HC73_9EURO|nr:uncharacterized protein Z520_05061 [Fonsecaea multimorphosa CBS 102226]KIX99485.1 hypothetical protein Z520_05061 [Fonsecaea multimorphosa CBS 102226]OAL25480.1 hypothetical protein AYO22_04799 [Fonsecaea multimorphosa]
MATTTTFHSWIHHDSQADRDSLSSQKSQVFRHVAAHRKWERLQRTRKLRASALNVYHTFQEQGQPRSQIDTHFAGSCDPFDTLPIPHTYQVNELLQFDQRHLSPALAKSIISLHPSATFLQDELAAYGFLARIAAVKARCDPHPEAFNVVLKLKDKAMQQLRLNLSQTPLARLPKAVMSLLFAETWCYNLEAVAVHLRLLEVINSHSGLDTDDLICVLHSDIQRATLTLGSPLFTVDGNTWDILEAEYTAFLWPQSDADTSIQWPQLQPLVDMKKALVALHVLKTSEVSEAVRQAATIKFLHIMRTLLEQYRTSPDDVEQCVALAALYRLRLEANMERIPLFKITVYNAGKEILSRLQELLTVISNDAPSVRLWVLFVGTMSGDHWFREEFTIQAQTLGLTSTDRIKACLDVFEEQGVPYSLMDRPENC